MKVTKFRRDGITKEEQKKKQSEDSSLALFCQLDLLPLVDVCPGGTKNGDYALPVVRLPRCDGIICRADMSYSYPQAHVYLHSPALVILSCD